MKKFIAGLGIAVVVMFCLFAAYEVNRNIENNNEKSFGFTEFYYKDAPLHLAVYNGDAKEVERLLASGADVNAQHDNETPLHVAFYEKDNAGKSVAKKDKEEKEKIVKILLAAGADVNVKDKNGRTPLHLASSSGKTESVALLLANGADVNAKNNHEQTPLHNLRGSHHWHSPGCGCMHQTESGFEHKEIAKLLIDAGADINAKDRDGNTPLHIINMGEGNARGQLEATELLIAAGADVNAKNNAGEIPLHVVGANRYMHKRFQPEYVKTIKVLLTNGADVNAKDNNGKTPLHYSAGRYENEKIVKALLEGGADVNAKDNDGETPIHKIMKTGSSTNIFGKIVRHLLKAGADVKAENKKGEPILYAVVADSHYNTEIVELLIDNGADVNVIYEGETPLFHLIRHTHARSTRNRDYKEDMKMAKLLVSKGADINMEYDGKTLLDLETEKDWVQFLLDNGAKAARYKAAQDENIEKVKDVKNMKIQDLVRQIKKNQESVSE